MFRSYTEKKEIGKTNIYSITITKDSEFLDSPDINVRKLKIDDEDEDEDEEE